MKSTVRSAEGSAVAVAKARGEGGSSRTTAKSDRARAERGVAVMRQMRNDLSGTTSRRPRAAEATREQADADEPRRDHAAHP
jgi:hypothetical protein